MRYVEVRRHTMRNKPGKHLSQAGVALARKVGEKMGPFDRVISSPLPRAFETAIAMGFAFDEKEKELSEAMDDLGDEFAWDAGFAGVAEQVKRSATVEKFARGQAKLWRNIARDLPEGGRALVVTHGGFIEAGAVASLPETDHKAWGPALSFCEGVLAVYEDDKCVEIQILRVQDEEIATPS